MLLEVLIAFLIAALALDVLYAQAASALVATRQAGSYQEGLSRARSRLAALSDAALVPQETEGEDGHDFHWHTHVAPLRTLRPSAPVPVKTSPYVSGVTLYDVSVTVSWSASGERRDVVLRTQALGPAPKG